MPLAELLRTSVADVTCQTVTLSYLQLLVTSEVLTECVLDTRQFHLVNFFNVLFKCIVFIKIE